MDFYQQLINTFVLLNVGVASFSFYSNNISHKSFVVILLVISA